MMRHDLLNRLHESQQDRSNRIADMHIELDPADHEEPTWEVRQPGDVRPKRLDRRTRVMLAVAAAAAVVVNAGAAWAYWQITGSETAHAAAGATVELALRARSDLNVPLRHGRTGNLVVTVINDNDFPIRITSMNPGVGNAVADPEHREAGCTSAAAVTMTAPHFPVRWDVPRNSVGAFTVPGALTMRPNADAACAEAMFTVPVQVTGVRRDAS